jgi:hypothetical protein
MEDQRTLKGTQGVPYPVRNKTLSESKIEKQLTMGKMGRMTHSSALLIPCP